MERRPYGAVVHKDPETGEETIRLEEREAIPLLINAETGAIINSIRSSLDVLANVLAERNGSTNPREVRFPIARSVDGFESGKRGGRNAIKALSSSDQSIIEKLKPYRGGNDLLYALHHLDIVRKHQRLISVSASARGIYFFNWAAAPQTDLSYAGTPLEHGTVLARVPRGSNYQVKLRLEVTLSEAGILSGSPIASSLRKLAGHASSIIKLFDN